MRLVKLLIFSFGLITFGQPSWKAVPNITPNINNQRFDDVYFLDENTGWTANGYYASVFKTTDGGLTWTEQLDEADLTGDFYFRNINFLNENIGFLGTLNDTFFKTIDGGDTWTAVTNISTNPNAICGLDTVGSSTVYGCGAFFEPAHIIKSTDSGSTWEYIDMSTYADALVEIKFLTETLGYVGGQSSTGAIVLKTTDGGTTWTEIFNSNIAGQYVWKLQVLDSDNDVIFGSIDTTAPNQGQLIKTTDGGVNWTSYNAPESKIQALGFINENRGWMGGHTTGFYETNDGGQSWTNINVGSNLNRIFIINSSLAYASGTSIYKFTSETLDVTNFEDTYTENPLEIHFSKNPVEDVLKLTIDFKSSDNILINLYDINGKQLKKLKREIVTAAVKKEYTFNVDYLVKGTYIIEFHNNLGRLSKKFIKL